MTRTFKPTSTMIGTARTVFMAMAYTKTTRSIVQEYQQKNIEIIKPLDDEGTHVTLKNDWRMNEKDFADYIEFNHQDAIKAGFKVPEKGYCPLLMAEEQERQSKREFAKVMIAHLRPMIPGLNLEMLLRNLDAYNEFIEKSLRLMASYV